MEFYLDSDLNWIPIIRLSAHLPHEHQEMILAIAKIPPPIKTETKDQQTWLINENNLNRWIGLRLDYLQQKQLGLLPEDPLDHPLFFDFRFKPLIAVESEYWFGLLQVAIEGWELIKEAAIREKREFPFKNPRELIIEIFREKSLEYAVEKVFSPSLGAGSTFNEIRQNFRESSKFLRGRLEPADEARELEACRDGRWREFIVFAIWQYRFRGRQYKKLQQAWKNFLDAHKKFSAFLWKLPTHTDEEKFFALKWNKGHAVASATDSALNGAIALVPPVAIAAYRP